VTRVGVEPTRDRLSTCRLYQLAYPVMFDGHPTVAQEGLAPSRLAAPASETGMSANSTTRPVPPAAELRPPGSNRAAATIVDQRCVG
jgi:hypothetical protein